MIFVVDKRNAVLRYQNSSIRLEVNNELIQRVPVNQLALVIIYGNPIAETAVWRQLAAANIPTVMLNIRGKNQTAMIGSGLATQLPLRLKQHQFAGDEVLKVKMASWFVSKKIAGYYLPFALLQDNFNISAEQSDAFNLQMEQSQNHLNYVKSIAEVMGIEGQYAHTWFQLLADSLAADWHFSSRNRRPPKDPVNALLSLSYTLIMSEVRQFVLGFGFDPALGFLHQNRPGRDSFVLDIVEMFRAAVDNFVLHLLLDNQVTPDSFYYSEDTGCQLTKESRANYYRAWAIYRGNWPRPSVTQTGKIETVPVGEHITGQLMLVRETIKSMT